MLSFFSIHRFYDKNIFRKKKMVTIEQLYLLVEVGRQLSRDFFL